MKKCIYCQHFGKECDICKNIRKNFVDLKLVGKAFQVMK